MSSNPFKCECGCGLPVPIAPKTRKDRNWLKGYPVRFIHGHHNKLKKKSKTISNGYVLIFSPDHPNKDAREYVREHILIAEKAVGYFLPLKAVVHHVNEVRNDNRNANLVICENESYHRLLHKRARALRECGNANWIKSSCCNTYDSQSNMRRKQTKESVQAFYHPNCKTRFLR